MCLGDWESDGKPDVFVTDRAGRLHVFDAGGEETRLAAMPAVCSHIESGTIKDKGLVLLGYRNWGHQVCVWDQTGRQLWSYPCSSGVDGAHWGDLDGDGSDELIVGMNGGGGLHAVDETGKRLWASTEIGNVWTQSVIAAKNGRPALVVATEAGGTVRVFDAKGKALRTLQPLNRYFSPMAAADVDGEGTVQIVGLGSAVLVSYVAVGFDPQGKVAWQIPVSSDPGQWRVPQFGCGDLDGDGTRDWAFARTAQQLIVVTPEGKQIAALQTDAKPARIEILTVPGAPGMLVVLQGGIVRAYAPQ
jgi:outer membrane protein assembly factor BamB